MKVITLNKDEFRKCCRDLKTGVRASGFRFDTLVGIATGGDFVASEFEFESTLSIRRQRRLTAAKEGGLGTLISRLPRRINDLLRMAEASCRELCDHVIPPHAEESQLSPEIKTKLSKAQKILVVDDAIDSGATAASVVAAIKKTAPQADVRLAVITVTRPHPLIQADYSIFGPRTLVRFPWSADSRQS